MMGAHVLLEDPHVWTWGLASMARLLVLALAYLGLMGLPPVWADEFDRLEGTALTAIPQSRDAQSHESLTLEEIGNLPRALPGIRSALIVATTDQGNLARLLVSPALRKPPGRPGEPIPVLVLERLDTFEPGQAGHRVARARDLWLFDGFRVDLDSGNVVPEGQGADLQYLTAGAGSPRLVTLEGARMYTLTKPRPPGPSSPGQPSPGREVLPGDFAGRFRLFANGQWSGTLDLQAEGRDGLTGHFRSDETGRVYPVNGQVGDGEPNHVRFSIEYPQSSQVFEGYLWTEGKGALAGTMTMLDRHFGFFALREGGRFAPESNDLGSHAESSNDAKSQ